MDSGLQRFGVSIDSALLDQFDQVIEAKGYTNRSEAIRDLIRDYLVEEEWQRKEGGAPGGRDAVGTITLVYNHHIREMADKLTDLQHQFHEQIVSVLHVHLDAHNCLEVLVVKGNKSDIQMIAGRLNSTKGVKHCKLVTTTTGSNL
ncbi:MAG: nickel-responsive transcriptional regulator NikR [Firmicutes bacterium]|nr:nickel-responsive transcriptional regulator NikR [Bacillota bacterium]